MKANLTTTKVSVHCSVMHQGEYFEATGYGSFKWEISIDHNNHEVHQVKLYVPDQTLKCHLWILDNDGKEVELVDHEIDLKDVKVKPNQIRLGQAILPNSIDFSGSSPEVSFAGDPEEIF